MPIIGICGYKGSGKDTLADFLVNNENYIKIAFADFIRNALMKLFDWDESDFNPDKKELKDPYWGVTPRKMCQEIGTEFLRYHCKDFISTEFKLPNGEVYNGTFHIKRINKEIIKLLEIDPKGNIIFSDIRFQDELDYIKKLGGFIIRVSRNNISTNEFSNHISEKNILELKNVDFEIENNDTVLEFFKRIRVMIEHIEVNLPPDHL
tara:strand:- start:49 stop:669 length:621 start_codon:yes stop_codon:yes gene_type:complete